MITSIPFVQTLGIDADLTLTPGPHLRNHLGSLHAGALFTLAESASGQFLLETFPEHKKEAIPLLRRSQITYLRPATETIHTTVEIMEDEKVRFTDRLTRKKRASVTLSVSLHTHNEEIVAKADFEWFVTLG